MFVLHSFHIALKFSTNSPRSSSKFSLVRCLATFSELFASPSWEKKKTKKKRKTPITTGNERKIWRWMKKFPRFPRCQREMFANLWVYRGHNGRSHWPVSNNLLRGKKLGSLARWLKKKADEFFVKGSKMKFRVIDDRCPYKSNELTKKCGTGDEVFASIL